MPSSSSQSSFSSRRTPLRRKVEPDVDTGAGSEGDVEVGAMFKAVWDFFFFFFLNGNLIERKRE